MNGPVFGLGFALRGTELGLGLIISRGRPSLTNKNMDSPEAEPYIATNPLRLKPIGVIPKCTAHFFWKAVEAGARAGAKETGVEMIWKGSLNEDDPAQQIRIFAQLVAENVGGIVLAPIDDVALGRPVVAAMQKGIPVVIMDSPLKGKPVTDFVCTVSTDNNRAGEAAGKQLAKLLHGKGKVVLFRFKAGSASTGQRELGFLEAIQKFAEIQVILDNRYSGATIGKAQTTALSMLDKLNEADGIFCPNEPSTLGMLLALRQNNLASSKKLVGFDASPALVEGLKRGEIQALVAQNPLRMGAEAVRALVAKIKGETVPPFIDSGAAVITRDNLESPEIETLLVKSKDIQWSWVSTTAALKELNSNSNS